MAWVGIADGRIQSAVWFQGSVNSSLYLEQVIHHKYCLTVYEEFVYKSVFFPII